MSGAGHYLIPFLTASHFPMRLAAITEPYRCALITRSKV
jgi:hypothetical protein